jgi:hypothetical protein
MKTSAIWQQRQIAVCLVIFLAAPMTEAATALPVVSSQQAQTAPTAPAQNSESPADNSATTASQPQASTSDSGAAAAGEPAESSSALPSAPQQQQNGTSNPVGTAAAPYEKTTGVAASRPAGAVVAPAKQKRSRSFLIRMTLVIGACAAVGTVVALSAGSPSRP